MMKSSKVKKCPRKFFLINPAVELVADERGTEEKNVHLHHVIKICEVSNGFDGGNGTLAVAKDGIKKREDSAGFDGANGTLAVAKDGRPLAMKAPVEVVSAVVSEERGSQEKMVGSDHHHDSKRKREEDATGFGGGNGTLTVTNDGSPLAMKAPAEVVASFAYECGWEDKKLGSHHDSNKGEDLAVFGDVNGVLVAAKAGGVPVPMKARAEVVPSEVVSDEIRWQEKKVSSDHHDTTKREGSTGFGGGNGNLAAAKEDGRLAPMNGYESLKEKHRSDSRHFEKQAKRSTMLKMPRLFKTKVTAISLALLTMAGLSSAQEAPNGLRGPTVVDGRETDFPRRTTAQMDLHFLDDDTTMDLLSLDTSLLNVLKVNVCAVQVDASCTAVSSVSADSAPPERITFETKKFAYEVRWTPSGPSENYRLQVLVAGLHVGTTDYQWSKSGKKSKSLRVRFVIENSPKIRARVLTEQGGISPNVYAIVVALLAEFDLNAANVVALLADEGFSTVLLGQALKDVFALDEKTAAQILAAPSLAFASADVAAMLDTIYELNEQAIVEILKELSFTSVEIAVALRDVFLRPVPGIATFPDISSALVFDPQGTGKSQKGYGLVRDDVFLRPEPGIATITDISGGLVLDPHGGKNQKSDTSVLDESLLNYLLVSICQIDGANCPILAKLTSLDNDPKSLTMYTGKIPKFNGKWTTPKGSKRDGKVTVDIRISVLAAGLEVGSIDSTMPKGDLKIPFIVSANPTIRARILTQTGSSSTEIYHVVKAEFFNLSPLEIVRLLFNEQFEAKQAVVALEQNDFPVSVDDAVAMLKTVGYLAFQAGAALHDVLKLDAQATAGALQTAGYSAIGVAETLRDVFFTGPDVTKTILESLGSTGVVVSEAIQDVYVTDPKRAGTVLVASNFTANEVALAFRDVFYLQEADVVSILLELGLSAIELGTVLRDVFDLEAAAAVSILLNLGLSEIELGTVLKDVFKLEAAAAVSILLNLGLSPIELGTVLRDVFKLEAADAVSILFNLGFSQVELAEVLDIVFASTGLEAMVILHGLFPSIGSLDTAGNLKMANYSSSEIYEGLKQFPPFQSGGVNDAELILIKIQFSKNDVFEAVRADLLDRYEGWIRSHGPRILFHTSEEFMMSSVDWFLQTNQVFFEYRDGVCVYNGDIQLNKDNLPAIYEQLGSLGLAKRVFIGTPDPNPFMNSDSSCPFPDVPQGDPTYKSPGNLESAEASVHAVRIAQADQTDLCFWLWFPYNGGGAIDMSVSLKTKYGSSNVLEVPRLSVAPIGEHASDLEQLCMRFDDQTGQPIQATFSAHGHYSRYLYSDPGSLEFHGDGRLNVYSSFNGHALFPKPGENAHIELQLKDKGLPAGGILRFGFDIKARTFNDCDAGGSVLDTSSAYEIVAIDDHFLNSDGNKIPRSWVAFLGKWGPDASFSDGALAIVTTLIDDSGVVDDAVDIVAVLAAAACAIVAAPCAVFLGFGYFPCYAGCIIGVIIAVETEFDDEIEEFVADANKSINDLNKGTGKPSMGTRLLEWQYLAQVSESPRFLTVTVPTQGTLGPTVVVTVVIQSHFEVLKEFNAFVGGGNKEATVGALDSSKAGYEEYGIMVKQVELVIDDDEPVDITLQMSSVNDQGRITTTYTYETSRPDDGSYVVKARVIGEDGRTYEYGDPAIMVICSNDCFFMEPLELDRESLVEGSQLTVRGEFGANAASLVTLNWGDGTSEDVITAVDGVNPPFSLDHTYKADGKFDLTLTLSENGLLKRTVTASVLVKNAAPVVASVAASPSLLSASDPTTVLIRFTDLGVDDSHTTKIDWGDGNIDEIVTAVSDGIGGFTVTANHGYSASGVYKLLVDVTDESSKAKNGPPPAYIAVYNDGNYHAAGSGTVLPFEGVDGTEGVDGIEGVEEPFAFVFDDAKNLLLYGTSDFLFTASVTVFGSQDGTMITVKGTGGYTSVDDSDLDNPDGFDLTDLQFEAILSTTNFGLRIFTVQDDADQTELVYVEIDKAIASGSIVVSA